MQLSLSSEALPTLPLAELRRGARRRDLSGVELVVGGDGEAPQGDRVGSFLLEELGDGEGAPPIQWLLLREEASLTELLYWSRQAHLIGAGLVLQSAPVEFPLCVPLARFHSTDLEAAHRASAWARLHGAKTCWEIDLGSVDEDDIEPVLDVTSPMLAHVRVLGAGPEAQSASVGTGALFKELALRGYSGTIALAPSARGREAAWREWLFEERGWGCNTAARKRASN